MRELVPRFYVDFSNPVYLCCEVQLVAVELASIAPSHKDRKVSRIKRQDVECQT